MKDLTMRSVSPSAKLLELLPAMHLPTTVILYPACLLFFVFATACNKEDPANSTSDLASVSSGVTASEPTLIDTRFEHWAPGIVKVEAVVYDCEEGHADRLSKRPLVVRGEKHPFIVETQTRTLNSDEISQLATLLSVKHHKSNPAYCFVPHHGFLFYNARGEIHAHVEVCLLCQQGVSRPGEGLAKIWDYEGLKTFIASLGLPVFESVDEWDDYFARDL